MSNRPQFVKRSKWPVYAGLLCLTIIGVTAGIVILGSGPIQQATPFNVQPERLNVLIATGYTTHAQFLITTPETRTGTLTVTVYPDPSNSTFQFFTITPWHGSLSLGTNVVQVQIGLRENGQIASGYFVLTPVWT